MARHVGRFAAELPEVLALQVAACTDLDPRLPSRCASWTVGEAVSHSVATTAKFVRFARGDTDAPRTEATTWSLSAAAAHARQAWAAVDLSRTCRLPFGTFSADDAAGLNLLDALAHTWDCDPSVTAPDRVWSLGLAATSLVRPGGDHYAPPVPPAPGDGPRELFLKRLGRAC